MFNADSNPLKCGVQSHCSFAHISDGTKKRKIRCVKMFRINDMLNERRCFCGNTESPVSERVV